MRAVLAVVATAVILATASPAAAGSRSSCKAELDERGVAWKPATRKGIADGVEITGPLGGVAFSSWGPALVIDCSLAVSLAEAGRYLVALGIDAVEFSSAYARRNVRGTRRPSKHSFGLAIDIHTVSGPALGALRIDRDYEQGLGDLTDCVGAPLTQGGAVLKTLQCQLVRSGLFDLVLSPDYDDAHHDHFHLQVKPWGDRPALRSTAQAIH